MNYLTVVQWSQAVRLWRSGNDTAKIAERFGVKESVIYRLLPVYRDKWRNIDLNVAECDMGGK